MERIVGFNRHVQEIMFVHLNNDAQFYKRNKNIKYNMYICNRSNIPTNEGMEKYEYVVIKRNRIWK